mgnify:CR=1 FL=1
MNALMPARRAKPISLTALIDVVFILLMFFMLTSSFSQWVVLPLDSKAASHAASQDAPPPQLLVLKNDGSLMLASNGGDTSKSAPASQDFIDLDAAVVAIDNARALVVIPEADVVVQRIVDSMARLGTLNLPGLTLGQSLPAEEPTAVAEKTDAQHQ